MLIRYCFNLLFCYQKQFVYLLGLLVILRFVVIAMEGKKRTVEYIAKVLSCLTLTLIFVELCFTNHYSIFYIYTLTFFPLHYCMTTQFNGIVLKETLKQIP